MSKQKREIVMILAFLAFAGLALFGGMLGKKSGKVVSTGRHEAANSCAYDGMKINPFYQVDAYLMDGQTLGFCSIYCATRWFEENKDRVIYLTVIDEITGQKFDSTLGFYVESDVVTVPEVKNRIHVFAVKEDALVHAKQFRGKLIENPFGRAFVLPKVAQFDTLRVGVPALPDSLPLKLAVFKPIFKENRLEVQLVPLEGDDHAKSLLNGSAIEGFVCDLPTALLFAHGSHPVRIVKNVLRANPYRPIFAMVAQPNMDIHDFAGMAGQKIAVPKGVSFRFYAQYYLKELDVSLDNAVIHEVENVAKAWDLLHAGVVSAAVLRTPYTDMAMAKKMSFLADDRMLPWMSVLVLKQSVIENKAEVVKRFILGLEQSVLALNLKPDDYRTILEEQGGIPSGARKSFPMPIFEGANSPSPEEIQPILKWLANNGYMDEPIDYKQLVNLEFLPDPENVGLAYCCR